MHQKRWKRWKNEKWKNDFSPIDSDNYCYVDTYYSKAYLRHLIKSNENLACITNCEFYKIEREIEELQREFKSITEGK